MREALLVIGHGSRDREGIAESLALGRQLALRSPDRATAVAFLEFARPTIAEAIEQLVTAGAERIVCQPGMLFAAGHVKDDVPSAVLAATRRWPGVEFRTGQALDLHTKLLELCGIRWDEALRMRPPRGDQETLLLLVGRGASDADANARLAKIAQLLGERYRAGRAAACYTGLASPLLDDALGDAVRSGFRRIVVQPYFLFTGVLVKKIHDSTGRHAQQHPELEIFSTQHLGVHPLLVDVFEERASEALRGAPSISASVCPNCVELAGRRASAVQPRIGQ